MSRNLEFALRLRMDEALNRISSRIGKDVVREVRKEGFQIAMPRNGVNSWAPVLFGTMEPLADGCILRVSLDEKQLLPYEIFGLLFGGFWILGFIAGALPSPTVPLQHKILGLVGFGMVAGGCLAIRGFGRRTARGEGEALIRLIESVFADVRVP